MSATSKKTRESVHRKALYQEFSRINGNHPLKSAVKDAYIPYQARTRRGGEVFYFNFELAKEMGLIENNHPPMLNKNLVNTLLETFGIQIINEFDLANNVHIKKDDIKANTYMATRYLQLQHPGKRGKTSGDGRSIWNGYFKNKNITWDISSCGTGATALSPATAIEGKYFKTGDGNVSYGCGRSEVSEGLAAAINSEIFFYNQITTERTLAIIKYKDGSSINVRAARNLLRPAHMFRYLKQNNYHGLQEIVDYYIDRQVSNGEWPRNKTRKQNYQHLLHEVTLCFARLAAKFESEYIFCWMDWDGDNIMMNGGIIDFGSIRQFGLYHSEYRYDDVERMSTTLSGQKHQARYIVQTFVQLVDFLNTGKKKNIKLFRKHKNIRLFDKTFVEEKEKQLMYRIGFNPGMINALHNLPTFQKAIKAFMKYFSYFEQTQSISGIYKISDGVTSDAVFCMRDLLRELPVIYHGGETLVSHEEFIRLTRSDYARDEDVELYKSRKQKIRLLQKYYKQLVTLAAQHSNKKDDDMLREISRRSSVINRYDRVTGDSVMYVTNRMLKLNKTSGTNEMYKIFRHFVINETLKPESPLLKKERLSPLNKPGSKKELDQMLKIVKDTRSGI